jgi:hypothetical protein
VPARSADLDHAVERGHVRDVAADPDALVVVASYLRPEEAGMLRELLESTGIPATVRDEMLSSVHPFLQPVIGGVKLAVRAADAERAREIVESAGVLPGADRVETVEIPEEEWSRTPDGRLPDTTGIAKPTWARRAVVAAPVLAILFVLMRCVAGAAEP